MPARGAGVVLVAHQIKNDKINDTTAYVIVYIIFNLVIVYICALCTCTRG